MKIAITGGGGRIGRTITEQALARGDSVVSIDRVERAGQQNVTSIVADVANYDALLRAFEGCDAVIHMAAIPSPFRQPDHEVHQNNVVGSYNAMRAAAEQGISRVCQASSVNAIGLSYSRAGRFDYFPIDEHHPCHAEEPYGLSKWICEVQADSLARRYDRMRIASMRFHWVVPDRATAGASYNGLDAQTARHLWGYVLAQPAAAACLLALSAEFLGHEVFYIVAPDTTMDMPSLDLARRVYPDVPIRGDLSGFRSFFDCSKAGRILGWHHPPGRSESA